jgi:DNA-binding protein H-NS
MLLVSAVRTRGRHAKFVFFFAGGYGFSVQPEVNQGGLIGEINLKIAFSLLNHLRNEIPEYMTLIGHDRSQVKGRCMSTKKIDFEAMSFDDLWSLHEQISQILAVRITSEKRELERRLAVLNRSRGVVEPADGDSARAYKANGEARRKYPRVLPKYRNPQTSETWSGRGK